MIIIELKTFKKLIYKKEIWKLIYPEEFKFRPGIIRNILIENDKGIRVITNLKEIKPIKHKPITDFYNV